MVSPKSRPSEFKSFKFRSLPHSLKMTVVLCYDCDFDWALHSGLELIIISEEKRIHPWTCFSKPERTHIEDHITRFKPRFELPAFIIWGKISALTYYTAIPPTVETWTQFNVKSLDNGNIQRTWWLWMRLGSTKCSAPQND